MKRKLWLIAWWIIFLSSMMGCLPFPKLMKNKTKKVRITVSSCVAFVVSHWCWFSACHALGGVFGPRGMHLLIVLNCCNWSYRDALFTDYFFLFFFSSFEVFSSDRAVQSLTIRIACAFEQLVVLIRHWLNGFLPCASKERLEDEFRQEVKKLGGYLQLFLQVNWFA